MPAKAINLSIDSELLAQFQHIAKKHGIYASGFVTARMTEFIEKNQSYLADYKKPKK